MTLIFFCTIQPNSLYLCYVRYQSVMHYIRFYQFMSQAKRRFINLFNKDQPVHISINKICISSGFTDYCESIGKGKLYHYFLWFDFWRQEKNNSQFLHSVSIIMTKRFKLLFHYLTCRYFTAYKIPVQFKPKRNLSYNTQLHIISNCDSKDKAWAGFYLHKSLVILISLREFRRADL